MNPAALIPADIGINAAIAICAVAFVSGTARGFSGFGSALIFMPLASSIGDPRLVAALLLIIDFVAAAPLLPGAWEKADRKATAVMVAGALIGVPIGTYFLSRLEPVTTRWIISAFVFALLLLLLSGWRYRGKDHAAVSVGIGGLSGFCSGLAQTGGPPIVGYWLGRPRHRRLVRRFAVRQSQRSRIPRDLLRADRSRGDLWITGAGWCVAVASVSEVRRMGGAKRYPSCLRARVMGFAALYPSYDSVPITRSQYA